MSGGKRRSKRGRTKARIRPDPEGFWHQEAPATDTEPIEAAHDPTAVLRSIGAPPVPQGEQLVNEFLKTALRGSSLAAALADSVGLTADESDPT